MTRDEFVHPQDLAIVEKYRAALDYIYKLLPGFPRKHAELRTEITRLLKGIVNQLHHAAKSRQPSRLYAIDADLATLRFWLRFVADPALKIISHHQCAVAMRLLKEVGSMLGQWIKAARSNGRSGS